MEDGNRWLRALLEVFGAALRLGLTSFGGPMAHIGYFRAEYVVRRRWLDERRFADLVALTQLLPGPSSSQLGIAIGTLRAGPLGGLLAWLGFTAPSAIALIVLALLVGSADLGDAGWVRGLKLVAVAVVAQAVLAMARTLLPDWDRRVMAGAAAAALLLLPGTVDPVAVIAVGAALGALLVRWVRVPGLAAETSPVSRRAGLLALAAFVALLVGLPIAARATPDRAVAVAATFYESGSLVFGGGHVVLPLLEARVVDPGWIDEDRFLAGYGAAQAVPGPLFTFSAYLGASFTQPPNGVAGGVLSLLAIFLPSFLLVFGALAWWPALRARPRVTTALAGANAAVVGVLAAALIDPVGRSAIHVPLDVAIALFGFVALVALRLPPWVVVVAGALIGQGLSASGVG